MVLTNQSVPAAFLPRTDPFDPQVFQDGLLVDTGHSFWFWHPPSQHYSESNVPKNPLLPPPSLIHCSGLMQP
jgi:hypothetical protein